MRKFLPVLSLIAAWACAHASVSARADGAQLIVNEVPVIRFAARAGESRGDSRAQTVAGLLTALDGRTAMVQKREGCAVILVGKTEILSVTRGEAKYYGVSAFSLANSWAHSLSSALSLPPLRLEKTALRLAPKATKSFRLTGSAADRADLASSDPNIAIATRTNGQITVKSFKAGLVDISVITANAKETFRVRVLPFAVDFPQAITALVTGAPANPETIRNAVRSAFRSQLVRSPKAAIHYSIGAVLEIGTGDSRTYTLHVRASGPDAVPSEGDVAVTIRNQAMTGRMDQELWFCNRPESVLGPGELFSATLEPDRPVRMLYHHYNASGSELILRVTAVNSSDQIAEVRLIPGDSEPTLNPTLAGMKAAAQFARNWVCNSGEIVQIPPHSTLPITLRKVYPKQTLSGLCSMRLLPGGPDGVRVVASATPPFAMDDSWQAALQSSTPWCEVGSQPLTGKYLDELRPSEHIYGKPYLDIDFGFKVGEPDAVLKLGSREISRRGTHEKLGGNYGVIYNLRTTFENPTSQPVEVEMMFRASGGYSGGLFLIGGSVVQTPLLQPDQEVCVTTFHIPPGPRQFIMIQTLPLSGSSYPATITLRLKEAAGPSNPAKVGDKLAAHTSQ